MFDFQPESRTSRRKPALLLSTWAKKKAASCEAALTNFGV
jgi:hypothetical protein